MIESIDKTVLVKDFKCLKPLMANKQMKNSLRFLSIFGFEGEEVIFATTDDEVFCYGRNRYGSLGLGFWNNHIPEPTLNKTLSGKGLVNVFDGFGDGVGNCIGLTADGLCYGWGFNDSGQLGIGNTNNINTPQMVEGMADRFVVQIGCGKRHALALDREGKVFAWGCNWFGQTSGKGQKDVIPIHVKIDNKISSISCGKCHSLALSESGRVYVWGLNESGQLGRHRDQDPKAGANQRAFSSVPQLVSGFESTSISKALCGPNHTIVLTNDGFIYTFGFNENGQIGNGGSENQWLPYRVGDDMTFKEFVNNYDLDLTIAVTTDHKIFVWGFNYYNIKISTPYEVTDYKTKYCLFDIYAHFMPVPRVYQTIVFEANEHWLQRYRSCRRSHSVVGKEVIDEPNLRLPSRPTFGSKNPRNSSSVKSKINLSNGSPVSAPPDEEITSGTIFLKHLIRAFDNPNDYDMKFVINGDVIHCHKTIVRIRNKHFWQHLDQTRDVATDEIRCEEYSYKSFHSFIQYLYAIEPKVNDKNCYELVQMANDFKEPELAYLCSVRLIHAINVTNVCFLYEFAINHSFKDLKNKCIEFSKNNWKTVCKSDEFQSMNEVMSKELMFLIIN